MTSTATAAPPVHACIGCAALPPAPAGLTITGSYARAGYQPPKPLATTGGPRSQRCTFHARAHRNATRARTAVTRKATRYGLGPALQRALWVAQGRACPCGAKRTPDTVDDPPAGVHTDHNHDLAAGHDHPDDRGCLDCVTGFLCSSCNRDIVGGLTGRYVAGRPAGRDSVAAALRRIADHLDSPPLPRLLAELASAEADTERNAA